jgi:hypothetical protein
MVTTVLTWAAGCDKPLDTNRTVEAYSSFGEIAYREGCQRVAWTGQLAQKEAGLRDKLDVSGATTYDTCVHGAVPPTDAPEKVKAIQQQRPLLIKTVDQILPKSLLSDLEDWLEKLLPLHDDGTMEKTIRSVADLLDTMYKDQDFTPALARLAVRAGYRPTKTAAGLVHTIVEYPQIDDFLGKLLNLIGPGGTAEAEWKQVLTAASKELTTAVPVPNTGDPERTLRLALNLMLSTHADLGNGTARPLVARDFRGIAKAAVANGQIAAPFVDVDGDGLADVDPAGRYVDAQKKPLDVPPPFPQPTETGTPDTAPRDTQGRLLTAKSSASTVYQYLDLDGTVIGGLSRETLTLMDPAKDTTLGLVYGASALLGPRTSQTKMYMDPAGGMMDALTYQGFDTSQAAVLDLLHAFLQILGDPNATDTLQATNTLLSKYESPATRLVKAMFDVNDLGKMHTEAMIPATSDLYDDLMPIVVRILRVKGLAQDIVKAMQDPHVRGVTPMIARLMRSKNQIDFDQTKCSPAFTACDFPLTSNLDGEQPVDRTKPDVDYNRSLMQRIAHLIHDANGAQFCNKAGAQVKLGPLSLITYQNACDMFEIDDLALFYVLNMATPSLIKSTQNTARADTTWKKGSFCEQIKDTNITGLINVAGETLMLEDQVQIKGFLCQPTPAALNRSLFLQQSSWSDFLTNTTDPVPCTDGDLFKDVHDKSIMAWETTMVNNPAGKIDPKYYNDTFYDAIRPLVDAFASHDECVGYDEKGNCTGLQNAAKIFVDLLAMLHKHWGSASSSYFGHMYQSTDPTMRRFAYPDNLVSYEPLLNEVLANQDLVPAVIDLSPTLLSFTVDGTPTGQPALPVLLGTASYLFDPGAAPATLTYRNGMTSTVMSDGKTAVPRATPYYMIADAFAHKRSALAQIDARQSGAWKSATSALVDQMLTVDKNMDGTFQFRNRRVHAVTAVLLDFVRSRILSHAKTGDLDNWVHKQLTQDLTDVLGGPVFAALGDFVAKVEADPDARTQLYSLLQYLMNEASNDLVFQTALTTLADQVQMFLDDPDLVPVARVLGRAMDPQQAVVETQLNFIKRARDVDTKKVFLSILRNTYHLDDQMIYPASNLADVLSEVNRTHPGQGGDLDATDYKTLLGEIRDFLIDDQRGFTRFLAIVKNRGPHGN